MSNYNHTPISKQSPKQVNNAQSDSKLIRLKTNLSFVSLIDWTAIILFVGLCVTHCVPAYAVTLDDVLVTGGDNIGYALVTLDNVTGYRKRQPLVFEHYKKGKNNVAQNETLVSKNNMVNQSITENETLMKQLNETVSFKNHLTNGNVGGYYKATTKYTAVKPSRHPLAIFVPITCGYYPHITTGTNTQSHTSYDGLREPNKIPFYGNKFRCLCTVVDTRHPIFSGGKLLTKYTGGQI